MTLKLHILSAEFSVECPRHVPRVLGKGRDVAIGKRTGGQASAKGTMRGRGAIGKGRRNEEEEEEAEKEEDDDP